MLSLAGLHAVIALRRLEYSNAAAEQTGMLQENYSILQENHTLRGAIFKAALSRKTRILQDELISVNLCPQQMLLRVQAVHTRICSRLCITPVPHVCASSHCVPHSS